jgi:uncharacterized protein (DUF2267 family)
MDYEAFIRHVSEGTGLGREDAVSASHAVLQTLAERIAPGEARDLAALLPPELAPWVATTAPAEGFDADEFVRRVAEREGADVPTAERHAEVVFAALAAAVGDKELTDVAAELSSDYDRLLPRGRVRHADSERFLRRVAERGALPVDDLDPARRAAEAVLETLAERISGGEVDDLLARLPIELHPALKRGRKRNDGKARAMALDEFLRLVAEREGATPDQARDHARAVLRTLREAVDDDEFFDVTAQLGRDYVDGLALV